MTRITGYAALDYDGPDTGKAGERLADRVETLMARDPDYDGDGEYSVHTIWHGDMVYDTWGEACAAVDRLNADGNRHAVLYHAPDPFAVDADPTVKRLYRRYSDATMRAWRLEEESDPHTRKGASIACPSCHSRIMLDRYAGTHDCPVCGADMRADGTRRRIRAAFDRARALQCEYEEARDRTLNRMAPAAPLEWCAAYEYRR